MQTAANAKAKKMSGTAGVKALIATLGVTSTLGLWGLFSRELQGNPEPAVTLEPVTSNLAQENNQAFLASLPPIPTLEPLSLQPVTGLQPAAPVPVFVSPPVVAPGKIYLGGAAPSAVTSSSSSSNTVITTTRSSK